jgi:hypothetical protein
MGRRSVRGPAKPWPQEHNDYLRQLLADGNSRSEAATALNETFGTTYTRNACIGRARRLDVAQQGRQPTYSCSEERKAAALLRKREKRWAADPSLKARYERLQAMKKNREAQIERGSTKTSAEYRRHVPKLANMTRGELRAMLAQACQNTAALEIAS